MGKNIGKNSNQQTNGGDMVAKVNIAVLGIIGIVLLIVPDGYADWYMFGGECDYEEDYYCKCVFDLGNNQESMQHNLYTASIGVKGTYSWGKCKPTASWRYRKGAVTNYGGGITSKGTLSQSAPRCYNECYAHYEQNRPRLKGLKRWLLTFGEPWACRNNQGDANGCKADPY